MKRRLLLLATALCLLVPDAFAQSKVPSLINYQGNVRNSAGVPIGSGTPVNRTVTFRFYKSPTSVLTADRLWSESQTVTILDGNFNVLIGNGTPVGAEANAVTPFANVFSQSTSVYLGITVDDGNSGTVDAEISPRQQLVSGAFAFRATVAESVDNQAITTGMLAGSSVTTNQLGSAAVTTAKIDNSAVTNDKIQNGTIQEGKLADSSVTSVKILDGTIVSTDIAADTITAGNIAPGAVASSEILDGSIEDVDIKDSAVTTTKIGPAAVTATKIAGGSVNAQKLSGEQPGGAPVYGCRAWVNFDATRDTSGAVSTANTDRFIRASGNVSSVKRNSRGDFSIIFTVPMSDPNYAAVHGWADTNASTDNNSAFGRVIYTYQKNAANYQIKTRGVAGVTAGGFYDFPFNDVVIFR